MKENGWGSACNIVLYKVPFYKNALKDISYKAREYKMFYPSEASYKYTQLPTTRISFFSMTSFAMRLLILWRGGAL